MGTVNVNPSNVLTAVPQSAPGDVLQFAPGTYTFTTNATGPAVQWLPGRTYVGNGAVLQLTGGPASSNAPELVKILGTSDLTTISGFVMTCAQFHMENGLFQFVNNTLQNGWRGVYAVNTSGNVDSNTFSNLTQEGVLAYPASNSSYSFNRMDGTGNDGIHLLASTTTASDSVAVNGNVILNCRRFAIELQNIFTNLQVQSNYGQTIQLAAPNSNMVYSLAVGYGNGILVADNIAIGLGRCAGAAYELMGSNVTFKNNIGWNMLQLVLNGTQGNFISQNNTGYGASVLFAQDATDWPISEPQSSGDALAPLGSMPPVPGVTPPTPPNAGASMFATSTTTTITLNFPPSTVAGSLVVTVKGNGAAFGTFPIPARTQAFTVSGLTPNWEYNFVLTQGTAQPLLTAQTLATAGAPSSSNGTPATPPIAPPAPIQLAVSVPLSSTDGGVSFTAGTATVSQ